MGKVYDALRRAEEQRARRIQEAREAGAAGAGLPPAIEESGDEAPEPAPHAPARHVEPRPEARPESPRRLRSRRGRAGDAAGRSALREDAGALNKRRVALLQPESFAAEQFRTLRARIDSLATQRPLRTLAVTSAVVGEGKSMAAIGLAAVSSMNVGSRVLLVDCDLREPAVHRSLGLSPRAGLAEVVRGEATLDDAVLRADGTALDVLGVRSLPSNPSELLGSEAMRKVMEELASRYDRVILDLPPVLGLPDAKEVSDMCDGTVFVVRAHVTRQEEADAALEVVDRSRVIGVVMNGADLDADRYGY